MKILLFTLLSFVNICEALVSRPEIFPNRTLNTKDILFLHEVLSLAVMAEFLDCKLQTDLTQETKVFSDKKIKVSHLKINFFSRIYDSSDETIVISEGLNYGRRMVSHLSEGPVEEFRIEFDDMYSSFIKFSHNGRGVLTGFVYGDIYHISPCAIKR